MPSLISELYSPSLELVVLVLAISANALIAYVVYWSNPKSATNVIFSLLSFFTSVWLINNYSVHHILESREYWDLALIIGRFGILWAAPMSVLLFLLAHTLPSDKILLRRKSFYTVVISTLFMMIVNVSPYAFVGISFSDNAVQLVPGVGLLPFSIISTAFSVLALYWLIKKFKLSRDTERKQLRLVLFGMLAMLALIIATVLLPIIVFNSLIFLPFTPLYTLLFFGMTAYAITKYQLFNVKILLTQALTTTISVVLFARFIGEESLSARIIDGLVLLFSIVFGFLLVRSVRKEVEQRMLIEQQEKELKVANQQQESLLHFISHEIKGYLTDAQAGFASIVEGDFGIVPPPLTTMAESALKSVRRGVATVIDILDASNLKKGTVAYAKKKFEFRTAIREIVQELKPAADTKNISIDVDIGKGQLLFEGDEEKIRRHVLRNLIDNAIKYTPSGTVHVSLTDGKVIRFTVQDSGVGITTEDMPKLFTEGGHGKDSIKINVHSTGYGLFIAKQVVEAHGGKILAESDGQNKGSRFIVEFPVT